MCRSLFKKISFALGFLLGIGITYTLHIAFQSVTSQTVSTEDVRWYYSNLIRSNYSFHTRHELDLLSERDIGYTSEQEFLGSMVKVLCYSSDDETANWKHAITIAHTWAKYCDLTLFFYSNVKLKKKLIADKRSLPSNFKLLFVDSSNSTIETLLDRFSKESFYNWLVYVPGYVYLNPNNLKYYLYSSRVDPSRIHAMGKPWFIASAGSSPFVLSSGAVERMRQSDDRRCIKKPMKELMCVLEVLKAPITVIKDYQLNDVMINVNYGNFFVRYAFPDVMNSMKCRFPVSIYVKGETFNKLLDMDYYLQHLKAFGIYPKLGSYVHLTNLSNNSAITGI